MRFLGAKVIITPAAERAVGMINKAIELAKAHGWFMNLQFENEANPDIHSRTTACEILDDFAGQRLDYWVTGHGTGGTLKGVARVLAKQRPETKIVVCEPDDAQLLVSGIMQSRNSDRTPAAPHPTFKPHPMQGWTPDFVPKLTDDVVAMKVIDRILPISGSDAIRCSKELATQEGIFVGITSGGTFAGALKVASEAENGANILCMLPDTGERYLSTPLFAGVPADMNEEELGFHDLRQARNSILERISLGCGFFSAHYSDRRRVRDRSVCRMADVRSGSIATQPLPPGRPPESAFARKRS